MNVQHKPLEKSYPYLCTLTFGDNLNDHQIKNIENKDILVMSLVTVSEDDRENPADESPKPYVSYLTGGKVGYFTKKESDYFRLPTGFEVKITQ